MNIIVDYFKRTGKLPCHHHQFADDIISSGFKQPPERALEWLKNRGNDLKVSVKWDELDAQAHDKAFTVAKVMNADLLQDFYNLVEKAKTEGWSLEKFQSETLPFAEKAGWTGNTLNRLRIIYKTNMQMAYAQGKYQQQSLLADQGLYPYLEYMPSTSSEPDPVHKHFYNKILRFDDPFWATHYPPGRFGCECSTRSVSQKEIDKKGLDIVKGDDLINQILNDPSLSKFYEIGNKGKLNPLEAWKPKTDVYVDGIKKELEKQLKNREPIKELPQVVLNKVHDNNILFDAIYNKFTDEQKNLVDNAISNISKIFENSNHAIRVEIDIISKILNSGKFKSQFETGTSNGIFSPTMRSNYEEKYLGYNKNIDPQNRPVYGYLYSDKNQRSANTYGDIIVILKDTKSNTTFTYSDSLDTDALICDTYKDIVKSKILTSFQDGNYDFNKIKSDLNKMLNFSNSKEYDWEYAYAEVQYHNQLTLNNIDYIIFKDYPDHEMVNLLDRFKIRWIKQ